MTTEKLAGEMATALADTLRQFTGTETWFRHPITRDFLYTEGVHFFANNAGGGAYWLLDILATQPEVRRGVTSKGFGIALLSAKDAAAWLTVSHDLGEHNKPIDVLFAKTITYTDCPDGQWKFYLQYDGEHIICMLPSEY